MHTENNTTAYQKAFQLYLRRGTSVEYTLRKATSHPTTHYIWRTRGDGKVRPSHAANNGKIFAWDNPPPTGHPSEDYGCRCWAEDYYDSRENFDDPPIEAVYPEFVFIPIWRFGRLILSLLRWVRDIDATTLTEEQAQNLIRFDKKLPKDASEIQILKGHNGQRIFRADVPARNIPKSFARYEKVVDSSGKTVSYTKTTFAPDGRIVHIKIK
jgi:SPP1 gp7 family putative phage head morphogenesis protein